jgi:hypothetical protein
MRRSCRQRDVYGEFVNLEVVSSRSSKILIGIGFVCVRVCVHKGEYACVVGVFVVLCKSKKQ